MKDFPKTSLMWVMNRHMIETSFKLASHSAQIVCFESIKFYKEKLIFLFLFILKWKIQLLVFFFCEWNGTVMSGINYLAEE